MEYNGDVRIGYCLDCCSRWFFTFNGAECRKPFAIDGVLLIYRNHGKTDSNIHRVAQIGGYCEGIPKGTVRVGFDVGSCVGKKAADAYTGWNSVTRIMIEDVPLSQWEVITLGGQPPFFALSLLNHWWPWWKISRSHIYSSLSNGDVLVEYSVSIKSITFNQIVVSCWLSDSSNRANY